MKTDAPSSTQVFACGVCGQVHARRPAKPGVVQRCCRCNAVLERNQSHSLAKTAAFALSALILYVPANMFPILNLELYGKSSESTVWDGVRTFYDQQDYLMAVIVLSASILVPVLKLLGLFFLVVTTALGSGPVEAVSHAAVHEHRVDRPLGHARRVRLVDLGGGGEVGRVGKGVGRIGPDPVRRRGDPDAVGYSKLRPTTHLAAGLLVGRCRPRPSPRAVGRRREALARDARRKTDARNGPFMNSRPVAEHHDHVLPGDAELPEPKQTRSRWPLLLIWVVPVMAAVVAGIYINRIVQKQGPEIAITFNDAGNLKTRDTRR